MRVASGMLTLQGRVLSHPPLVVKDKANGATFLDLVSRHTRLQFSIADPCVCQNKGRQGPTDAWNMVEHRVARAPENPATIAVAYTDRSQETSVRAIIMSEAFARCLNDLGQCAQSGLTIVTDCRSNQKGFVRLL